MDETDRTVGDVDGDDTVARHSAHEHAEHLQRRIRAVALEIAESEDEVASVYEEAARLRPHAAERLQEAARQARSYAEHERRFGREETSPGASS